MSGRIASACPVLAALDIARTRQFYEMLGFRAGYADDAYLIMVRDGVQLHFWRCDDRHVAENTSCYLYAPDVDALHADWQAAWSDAWSDDPAIRMRPPEDRAWGMREFYVWDPSGNLLKIGHDLQH